MQSKVIIRVKNIILALMRNPALIQLPSSYPNSRKLSWK